MARQAKASIKVLLNEKPALDAMKHMARGFKRQATSINQSLELVSKGFGLIKSGLSAAINITREYIKVADIQDKAERKYIGALKIRGEFTEEAFKAQGRFNSEVQKQVGIGDEVLFNLQAQLLAMGVHKDRVNEATKGVIGFSQVMGVSLETAAKLSVRALNGQTSALERYGIKATDAADATRQLSDLYGIAVATSDTLETRISILGAGFGDLKEVIGSGVTDSGSLTMAIDSMTGLMEDLQTVFKSEEGKNAINTFFGAVASAAADGIDAMLGLFKISTRMIEGWEVAKNKLGLGNGIISTEPIDEDGTTFAGSMEQLANRLRKSREGGVKDGSANRVGGVSKSKGGKGGGKGKAGKGSGDPLDGLGFMSALGDLATLQASFDQKADFLQTNGQRLQAIDDQLFDTKQKADKDKADLDRLMHEAKIAQMEEQYGVVRDVMSAGLGGALASGADALARGNFQIDEQLGKMMTSMGSMLIQLGAAAIAANLLSFIPFLAPIVGAPGMGLAAGVAAIAVGTGMVAAGSALGGGGGARSTPRTATRGGGGFRSSAPQGFAGPQSGGDRVNVFNITFGAAAIAGTPREVGRTIRNMVNRSSGLAVGAG